jgi:hypothetical protein
MSGAGLATSIGGAVVAFLLGMMANREFRERVIRFRNDGPLVALAIVPINFLLITIVFVADQRFLWPAYFASLLAAGYLLIRLAEEFRGPQNNEATGPAA